MRQLPAVEVTWVDSAHRSGWERLENRRKYQDVAVCRSVGFLLDRTKKQLRLVQSVDRELESAAEGLSIPAKAVISVRRLK